MPTNPLLDPRHPSCRLKPDATRIAQFADRLNQQGDTQLASQVRQVVRDLIVAQGADVGRPAVAQ